MNAQQRALLNVLQSPDNQYCADCSSPLWNNVHCVLPFGVFVCVDCAKVHAVRISKAIRSTHSNPQFDDDPSWMWGESSLNFSDVDKGGRTSNSDSGRASAALTAGSSGHGTLRLLSIRNDRWTKREVAFVRHVVSERGIHTSLHRIL